MLKACHSHRNSQLRYPLGCWLTATLTIQTWLTAVHPPTNTIYVKHDNLWQLYHPSTCSRSTVSFVATSRDPPPIDMLPITTSTTTGHRLRLHSYANHEETIIFPQSSATSFPQFLHSLPTHERWVFGHVPPQSPADFHNFLEAVCNSNFGLDSDNSVKGLSTTYSSRIQS